MNKKRWIIALALGFLLSPAAGEFLLPKDFGMEINAKTSSAKKGSGSSKKSKSKTDSKNNGSSRKKSGSGIKTIYRDTLTGEWINLGRRNIVTYCDAEGNVRAMSQFSTSPSSASNYVRALNLYADSLKDKGVRVYSLIAPTQGEFYMPPHIEGNRSQEGVFRQVAKGFSPDVTPIFVFDNIRKHKDEEIYNRTDHHWAPLGAFYASEALAGQLKLPFIPLDSYTADSVRNYVGSMFNFSGDPAIKRYPEVFVYFMPPGDYYAEFIDYTVKNKQTVGESEKHESSLFRKFPDGSGSAYSTFLGGDRHTVRIVNRNGHTGRRLLLVKDSFGNAMAPCLINSADEVHVIDFRYYPHNLLDYIEDNGITDLIFVNCPSIGFSKNTADRFMRLLTKNRAGEDEEEPEENDEEEDDTI